LPEELARKLEDLGQATKQKASDVARAAIRRYFNKVCGPGRSARAAILRSGLIGCGEGEADLSATYKSRLDDRAHRSADR